MQKNLFILLPFEGETFASYDTDHASSSMIELEHFVFVIVTFVLQKVLKLEVDLS